ncbi:unnamed protein product [Orchesella dallaii]|uniref:Chondroitin sulfate proteoglycan 4 n=1 Tax=Orchesella dallaii TaxID=48710 RepID=A0ABP1RIU4_9HEXA
MMINLAANEKYKSIENVYGTVGHPIEVVSGCDTELVDPQGGNQGTPDKIMIPTTTCYRRQLHIVARGHSFVSISSEMGDFERDKITVTAVASAFNDNDPENVLRLELETMSPSTPGLLVVLQFAHQEWRGWEWERGSDGQSTVVKFYGRHSLSESIQLNLRDISPITSNTAFLNIPAIQLGVSENDQGPLGQLVLERETRKIKVLYQLENEYGPGAKVVRGIEWLPNLFLVSGGAWNIRGGKEQVIVTVSSAAQRERLSVHAGDGKEDKTLILESEDESNSGTYLVNLEKWEMGFLNSPQMGYVNGIYHVLGRIRKPDSIHTDCYTKTVNGRGGAGKGKEDLIFISGNGCPQYSNRDTEIFTGKFTKVKNSATFSHVTYHVEELVTCDLELKATGTSFHLIKFGFQPWEQIKKVGFSEKEETLAFQVGEEVENEENERIQLFKMWRNSTSEDYSNPVFQFYQPGMQVTSDIQVGKDGVIAATFMVHGKGLGQREMVRGLPLHINRFLINITEIEDYNDSDSGKVPQPQGTIIGGVNTGANQFWLFQLASGLEILDGGNCFQLDDEGSQPQRQRPCTNYLEFAQSFQAGLPVEINLDGENENGFIESGGKILVEKLRNFHEIRGRNLNTGEAIDKVTLSSCNILKQISAVEEILIKPLVGCSMNLIMEIGEQTQVYFEDSIDEENVEEEFTERTFHYRFKATRSFDLNNGKSEVSYLGATHNYYLPFKIDDLKSIWFDLESETIYYSIFGVENNDDGDAFYHHSMIVGSSYDDQFYAQPVMVTEDGFKIQVCRDGTIMLVLGAGSSFPPDSLRNQVILSFEIKAKELRITFILQTDTQFIYVGHGDVKGDRNVLENVDVSQSHLVGGGANDAIYEIKVLEKDVFIYPGFELDNDIELDFVDDSENVGDTMNIKQTIDLTDIVVQIRSQSGTKYVPKVERKEDDLVISMDGYEDVYPGKIWIVNGALRTVARRLQLLLNNAIMDLIPASFIEKNGRIKRSSSSSSESTADEENHTDWKIHPRPIIISDAAVYSIAKEDLEDGHDIKIGGSSNKANTSEPDNKAFTAARNGTDLYLTNVLANSAEITTVIISDYFADSSVKSKVEDYDDARSENGTEYEDYPLSQHNSKETEEMEIEENAETEHNPSSLLFPDMVLGVTISLPGLNLLLNDSEIVRVKEKKGEGHNNDEDKEGNVLEMGLQQEQPAQIMEWKFVLFEVEQEILENVPEIPRMFKCDECEEKSCLVEYSVGGIALMFVIILVSVPSIAREVRSRRKGKYEMEIQRRSQRDVKSGTKKVKLMNLHNLK